ncbi:MAG: hypothetical protein R3F23_06420 [Verrucomicrobiia bacterium]
MLAFGVRFDDRAGKVEKFAEHGTIVHIDIDNSEINKNKIVQLPIQCDIRDALRLLNRLLDKNPIDKNQFKKWREKIAEWRRDYPFHFIDTPL